MYRRLTDLHLKLDSRTDAAAAWVEASRAYAKAGNSTGERFSQFAGALCVVWKSCERGWRRRGPAPMPAAAQASTFLNSCREFVFGMP